VDGVELEYVGSAVFEIELVDIDRLSRFELIGLAKDVRFTNMEEFYYLMPGTSLRESLRTCHKDSPSVDIDAIAAI